MEGQAFYLPCPTDVVPALIGDLALRAGTRIEPAFHLKTNVPASVVTMFP